MSGLEDEAATCSHESMVNCKTLCADPECSSDPTSIWVSEEQVVEVCADGYRTGVCSSDWDDTDASVVCRQLSLEDSGGKPY